MINPHGGDTNNTESDFSVSLNPLGIPKDVSAAVEEAARYATEMMAYPQYGSGRLKEALLSFTEMNAGKRTELTADNILAGSGASELLTAVCLALRPRRVLIPVPSF